MVFSSVPFLFFFLPIFLLAYFLSPGTRGKNATLLAASLLFYAWGEPAFVFVLIGSIAFNTGAAIVIDGAQGGARTAALAAAVTANLLLLAAFKYARFALTSLDAMLGPLGYGVPIPVVPLPLGISFFTFHCLSYVIDVYRRRFPANRRPGEVALYIALFPQLVAGPIVRYKTVARQLRARRPTFGRASAGARIFIIGLAQKVLIADQVARLADVVFDGTVHPTSVEAWLGLLAYTIQIYFDFAGYSSMAIGLGLILGFTLPRNFRVPYASLSITDFWRRWHMSLSSWLRDYLYIPLGGNKRGRARTYGNLATVFLLCGLWHGANWTFVLWGAWHGGFLVIERLGLGAILARLPAVLRWAYTILVLMLGWVLFRAGDITSAATMFGGLFGHFGRAHVRFDVHLELMPGVALVLGSGAALAVLPRWLKTPAACTGPVGTLVDGAATMALFGLSMLYVAAGTYSPFLYFRF